MPLPDRRAFIRLLAAAPRAALVVSTLAGQVRGAAVDGIRVFTGIPYGRARRFGIPRPAARWPGVFDATRPARLAPQPPDMVTFPTEASEDCLQLNVWAPAGPAPGDGVYPRRCE